MYFLLFRTQEQDPLLNGGGKRETVVSMQKNGNNVSLGNNRDIVV